jgi:hypothetical protein
VGCGGRGACEDERKMLADGEVVWAIFWYPVKDAESNKTLYLKGFSSTLIHRLSAHFAKFHQI